ncbi:MAG: L-histidine N(alpha)-methyltransferase [Ferruginibacter sp.]
MNAFLNDVISGLSSETKHLNSKYFYDKKGDEIFQQIMNCDEYYLTNAEMEIFSQQSHLIADAVINNSEKIDVIELGPGDVTKSRFLLKELLKRNALGKYFPIDISENIIEVINNDLPTDLPGIKINGLNGDYLEMLPEANKISKNRKLILLLGANIGNFNFLEMEDFFKNLRSKLSNDDMLLIGFDIKKNPNKILAAYSDKEGYTKDFNLNLLTRINRELNADFEINNFEHFAMYNPESGECKSFLISLKDQEVNIGNNKIIFIKDEPVFMEVSKKYSLKEIDEISVNYGFSPLEKFSDCNKYFLDALWKCST